MIWKENSRRSCFDRKKNDKNAEKNIIKLFNDMRRSLTPRRMMKIEPVEVAMQASRRVENEIIEGRGPLILPVFLPRNKILIRQLKKTE